MSDIEMDGPKYRIASGQAICQQAACKRAGTKIAKGELRVGTNTHFNRDEETRWYMAWRHWNCISKHDIDALESCNERDGMVGFDGLETIHVNFNQAVLETLRTSELIDVSKEEAPTPKPKKARAKRRNVVDQDGSAGEASKPMRSRKKRPAREVETSSDAEPEYVPKKSRSRSKPKELLVDPVVANIEAMATAMCDNAEAR
ncbi:hypothetical protein E8E12_002796 [Didymella heteroderae]|uniref:PARP-type domain-containing protein n=1 Tax=Didymella heteroderae TaxID=1769908 RepID=A0A9P4WT46_9PLEO|nr:hypothetical protein E8E12_002796 [Didymella heteroderae]